MTPLLKCKISLPRLPQRETTSIQKSQIATSNSVLTQLNKREKGVSATIFTQHISQKFQLDINRHNSQYPAIEVAHFNKAHDRFLFIDEEVYHIGASMKDLGKKWFGFTLMRDLTAADLLEKIKGDSL